MEWAENARFLPNPHSDGAPVEYAAEAALSAAMALVHSCGQIQKQIAGAVIDLRVRAASVQPYTCAGKCGPQASVCEFFPLHIG